MGISSSLSQLDTLLQNAKQFLTDFKQVGTDLEGGNVSAAQQDFVTLSKDAQASAPVSSTSSSASGSAQSKQATLVQDFKALSQDLQSGNLSGAQQAYTQVVQDVQSRGGHHHHRAGESGGSSQLQTLLGSTPGAVVSSTTSSSSASQSSIAATSSSFDVTA
jgi:hypothetical protein